MSKCCDRCKKPIDDKDTMTIKFKVNWTEFVRDIELAIMRKRQGYTDPSYYHKTGKGKWELCEECRNGLVEYLYLEGE